MATTRIVTKPELTPMKVAQVPKPGADFEIVEREIPEPDAGHVRIKVQACGVCSSEPSFVPMWSDIENLNQRTQLRVEAFRGREALPCCVLEDAIVIAINSKPSRYSPGELDY